MTNCRSVTAEGVINSLPNKAPQPLSSTNQLVNKGLIKEKLKQKIMSFRTSACRVLIGVETDHLRSLKQCTDCSTLHCVPACPPLLIGASLLTRCLSNHIRDSLPSPKCRDLDPCHSPPGSAQRGCPMHLLSTREAVRQKSSLQTKPTAWSGCCCNFPYQEHAQRMTIHLQQLLVHDGARGHSNALKASNEELLRT